MINDLDETLRELLIRSVPIDPTVVDISFDLPNRDWGAARSKPTLNLFLYDVRENHELRSNERYLTRHDATGTEVRAPARIDLTYIVSAWTAEIDDEHKLIGDVMRGLLSNPVLPPEVLKGVMVNQPFPLHAWIAQPERTPNAWDLWGSLESRLKVSFPYVVTLAFDTTAPVEVRLVTEKVLTVEHIS